MIACDCTICKERCPCVVNKFECSDACACRECKNRDEECDETDNEADDEADDDGAVDSDMDSDYD